MLLTDMHVWFRQYAQQMGMQNTRAILPEQIDILLNTSINDIVNQIIKENIGITNDRVITDNSKIGQINALRTLYKVKEIPFAGTEPEPFSHVITADDLKSAISHRCTLYFDINDNQYVIELWAPGEYTNDTVIEGLYEILDAYQATNQDFRNDVLFSVTGDVLEIRFRENVKTYGMWIEDEDNMDAENNYPIYYEIPTTTIPTLKHIYPFTFNYKNRYSGLFKSSIDYTFPEHLYLVDFSINYVTAKKGYNNNGTSFEYNEDFVTNYYPIRLIDDTYLADTLNDFVLRNRLRSPILTIYNNNTYDLYIDKFENYGDAASPNWTLPGNLLPYTFRMSYIGKPAKVKFNEDLGIPNVECDLPDYLHIDIIKHAVDLYHVAISGNLHSAQQQQQNQQREDVRNNASN